MHVSRGIVVGALALSAALGLACSSSSSSGNTSGDGGSGSSSGGSETLCARLGGMTGIAGAVKVVATAEVTDPMIGPFFCGVGASGHPGTAQDIEDCLTNQLGEAAGCSGVTYAGSKAASGFACRDMASAHKNIAKISDAVFMEFMTNAGTALKGIKDSSGKQAVSDADIATIASVLMGQQSTIETASGTGTLAASCSSGDAGGGDSGGD